MKTSCAVRDAKFGLFKHLQVVNCFQMLAKGSADIWKYMQLQSNLRILYYIMQFIQNLKVCEECYKEREKKNQAKPFRL